MSHEGARVLLVHPPYVDFTYPYHSIAYVAAPLRAAGYAVDIFDLNVAWFRSVFRFEQVREWRAQLEAEYLALDGRPALPIADQGRLVRTLQLLGLCNFVQPEQAVDTFQSEAFYDWDKYLLAREQVRAFEQLLNHFYKPFDFFRAFAVPPHEPAARALVDRAVRSPRVGDFVRLLRDRFGDCSYLWCGVSVSFSAQLLPGVATLKALGDVFPGVPRVAGGTAVSDVYRYRADDSALAPFREVCEFFYVGEAETAVVPFSAWCSGAGGVPPDQVVRLDDPPAARSPALNYVSLSTKKEGNRPFVEYSWKHAPPVYDWVEWDMYLSPRKRVNYSPSRGCFWNKCTFCDYGLNSDGPTAPSRTMDVAVVVEHLTGLVRQGIDHVYFAVDAIAPKFVETLAEQVIAAGLGLHWSSQFFLTRNFTPEMVRLLEASGLRLASFGLESGSSCVLDRMGKGTDRVEQVLRPALESFRRSRVGLQPLFFFGFPGETGEDRQKTVDFLREHLDVFTTVTKGGRFDLLPGSMVAKDPQAFGLVATRRVTGDDIAGAMEYETETGEPAAPGCDDLRPFNDQLPHSVFNERPWAGGIDTFHSQLYVERYGRDVFHRMHNRHPRAGPPRVPIQVVSSFDLGVVFENVVVYQSIQSSAGREAVDQVLAREAEGALDAILAPVRNPRCPAVYDLTLCPYHES